MLPLLGPSDVTTPQSVLDYHPGMVCQLPLRRDPTQRATGLFPRVHFYNNEGIMILILWLLRRLNLMSIPISESGDVATLLSNRGDSRATDCVCRFAINLHHESTITNYKLSEFIMENLGYHCLQQPILASWWRMWIPLPTPLPRSTDEARTGS